MLRTVLLITVMTSVRKTAVQILLMLTASAFFVSCQSYAPSEQTVRELKVVTSGGFAAAYNVLGPAFEAQTGVSLQISYGSSSGGAPDSIPSRLERGEDFDVIILSQSSLNNLTDLG